MKCAACSRPLQPIETLRVDGRSLGKPVTFFVHRPSEDGRCFRQVVFGSTDVISLVEMDKFEPIEQTVPYRCPLCTGGDYYGKALFRDSEGMLEPVPPCVNDHRDEAGEKIEVMLVPTAGFVEPERGPKHVVVNLNDRDAIRAMKGL